MAQIVFQNGVRGFKAAWNSYDLTWTLLRVRHNYRRRLENWRCFYVEIVVDGDGDVSVDRMTSMRFLWMTVLTLWAPLPLWCDPIPRRSTSGSLADRLLSLWTLGDAQSDSPPRSSMKPDQSLKKVLEFLSSKAATTPNKKLPNAALKGLSALVSGEANRPRPINLKDNAPMKSVEMYFQDLQITSKDCQLRTVCELLTAPQASYGIFGELLNFVFGKEDPDSSLIGPYDPNSYKEFYDAAQNGRRMHDCLGIYNKCPTSYREYVKLVNM